MSISEFFVVIIVAFILIKPEDLPYIIKQIKKVRRFFSNIKNDVTSSFDKNLFNEDDELEIEQTNKYLSKIASLGKKYEGNYNLSDIKSFYHKLLKESKQDLE